MRRGRKEGRENPSFLGNSSIPQSFSFKNADSWHRFLLIQKKSCLFFLLNSSIPRSFYHCWDPFLSIKTPRIKVNQGCVCQQNTTSVSELPRKPRSKPQQCPWTTCLEQRGAAGIRLWHSQRSCSNNCAMPVPITELRDEAWLPNDREMLPFAGSLFGKNPAFLLGCASGESC